MCVQQSIVHVLCKGHVLSKDARRYRMMTEQRETDLRLGLLFRDFNRPSSAVSWYVCCSCQNSRNDSSLSIVFIGPLHITLAARTAHGVPKTKWRSRVVEYIRTSSLSGEKRPRIGRKSSSTRPQPEPYGISRIFTTGYLSISSALAPVWRTLPHNQKHRCQSVWDQTVAILVVLRFTRPISWIWTQIYEHQGIFIHRDHLQSLAIILKYI